MLRVSRVKFVRSDKKPPPFPPSTVENRKQSRQFSNHHRQGWCIKQHSFARLINNSRSEKGEKLFDYICSRHSSRHDSKKKAEQTVKLQRRGRSLVERRVWKFHSPTNLALVLPTREEDEDEDKYQGKLMNVLKTSSGEVFNFLSRSHSLHDLHGAILKLK